MAINLEPEIVKMIEASNSSSPKVAVDEKAVTQPLMGEGDHSEGEVAPDPHVWQNAENGVQIVQTVAQELETTAPENQSLYEKNAQEMITRLNQIDKWIHSQIATIPANQRKLVTTHDAFGYYSKAYNIPIEPLQGLSTESRPSSARVKELVNTIEGSNVPTIFTELTTNSAVLKTVAREANVKISDQPLYTDSLGKSGDGVNSYEDLLVANTRAIVEGLGGKYTPFRADNNN